MKYWQGNKITFSQTNDLKTSRNAGQLLGRYEMFPLYSATGITVKIHRWFSLVLLVVFVCACVCALALNVL